MKYEDIGNAISSFNNYENRTGVKMLSVKELIKDGDIAIWIKESSNGQQGFFIVYKVPVTCDDNWLFWCISQSQIDFLIRDLSKLNIDMERIRKEKHYDN